MKITSCDCMDRLEKHYTLPISKAEWFEFVDAGVIFNSDLEELGVKTFTNTKWGIGKKTVKSRIIHSFCPFCGTKYKSA
jgi:hypothetical protein